MTTPKYAIEWNRDALVADRQTVARLMLLADALVESAELHEAENCYRQAVFLADQLVDEHDSRCDLAASFGQLLTQLGKQEEAEQWLRIAESLIDSGKVKTQHHSDVYDAWAAFFRQKGDSATAKRYALLAKKSFASITTNLRRRFEQSQKHQPADSVVEASESAVPLDRSSVLAEKHSTDSTSKRRLPKPIAKRVATKRAEWEKKLHSLIDSALHLPTDAQIQCISALTDCGALDSTDPVPVDSILDAIQKHGSWDKMGLRELCERAKLSGFVSKKNRRLSRRKAKGTQVRMRAFTEGAEETTYALAAPPMEILARVAAGLIGATGLRQEVRQCFLQLVTALRIDPALEQAIQLWLSDFPTV